MLTFKLKLISKELEKVSSFVGIKFKHIVQGDSYLFKIIDYNHDLKSFRIEHVGLNFTSFYKSDSVISKLISGSYQAIK